jgi:D-arabinose 1-dehydrogenase-like Zn-dependent alcohol dehydrogenase
MSEAATQVPASPAVKTFTAKAYAAQSATSGMAPHTIKRREPRPQDVQIEILYCGICHSDLMNSSAASPRWGAP